MGVSVSGQTIRKMVNSLTKDVQRRNKTLPPSQIIYDNFNIDFKVAQPTAGHSQTQVSMTSAMFAHYAAGFDRRDLRFTKELHEPSRFNKDNLPNDPKIYTPHIHHILPSNDGNLDKTLAWHQGSINICIICGQRRQVNL